MHPEFIMNHFEFRYFDVVKFKKHYYRNRSKNFDEAINYLKIKFAIFDQIKNKNLNDAEDYYKQFISQSCLKKHPFNQEFQKRLSTKVFFR